MDEIDYKKMAAWVIVVLIGLPLFIMIIFKATFLIPLGLLGVAIHYLVKNK